jgi:hypothetical protein
MRPFICSAFLIACLTVGAIASGNTLAAPKAVKAIYSVTMNGMPIGSISEQFEAEGANYHIVSETKPTGLAVFLQRQPLRFLSRGEVTQGGLKPTQFEGRRNATDAPQVSAEFDWAQSQVQLNYNGKAESLPLNPGTQDRLSIMYQLMFLPPDKSRYVQYWMTNGRKLDLYRYRAEPNVGLDTPLGHLKTVHLVKQREAGESQAEVWISPRHQNVAVKVVIIEKDGMRYEQLIQSLEVRD